MYTVYRNYYRYGSEFDPVDVTIKEFKTLEKAYAYIHRYAGGLRYCSAYVEDENGVEIACHVAGRGWYEDGKWK